MDDNFSTETADLVTSPSMVDFGECPILVVSRNHNALNATFHAFLDNYKGSFKLFWLNDSCDEAINWAKTILPHMKHIIVDASEPDNLVLATWFAGDPKAAAFLEPVTVDSVDLPQLGESLQYAEFTRLVGWRCHNTITAALDQRLEQAAKYS